MGKTIWKFVIPVTDRVEIPMPEGALLLQHVYAPAEDTLWVWAAVDEPEDGAGLLEHRTFLVVGTGNPMPEVEEGKGMIYVGTAVAGRFVWHLFGLVRYEEPVGVEPGLSAEDMAALRERLRG